MFTTRELANLVDMAGVMPMTNGWQVVVRAEWTDVTPERPHGLSYALILQTAKGTRLLGFDNAHAPDDAAPGATWDHEHRAGHVGQRLPYAFKSASQTIVDFFDRVGRLCAARGQPFEFAE